ncbi:MAG: type II secretion system protein GspL [Halothiobacillaceae bacterium]
MPASLMTLRPLDEDRCAWVLETDDGMQSGKAGWSDLPRPPETTRTRLLLPGDMVTHASARLAARNPRLIAQALPYALEEQLAEEIEQLRIAHGPRDSSGQVQARIVRSQDLDLLLERLRQNGIQPDAVYSELDALPVPTEGWTTLAWDGIVLARGSEGQALALEPGLLGPLLDGAAPVRAIETPEGPLPWLHRHLHERGMIDLIGGGRSAGLGDRLRPWRTPAILAATALLLQAGLMLHDIRNLDRQRAAMQAEIERMAHEAAPEVRRWVNPIAQLRQLATGGTAPPAESGMLDLLARLAPALAARPEIKLGNLRFQGGTLEAQLSAAEGGSLEALLETLRKQQGASAELAEQRVESGQATARLRLKGKRA